jgi:AcrR family transcriptional regulator
VSADKIETVSRKGRDARRQAIIDVAREVFLTQGYADASMSEIAARVGGSKGTLYNYFASKEALFAAFMEEECLLEATMAYEINAADEPDVAAALTSVGDRLLRFVLSDKVLAIHRLVMAEAPRFPELGRTFYETGPRRGLVILCEHMARWMDEGRLRRAEPFRAAEQFADLLKSGLHQRRLWSVSDPSEADIARNVSEAVRMFMADYGL